MNHCLIIRRKEKDGEKEMGEQRKVDRGALEKSWKMEMSGEVEKESQCYGCKVKMEKKLEVYHREKTEEELH